MSVKLHRLSYEYAKNLISNRQCVLDERSDWTDHRPARTAEGRFIEQHGFAEATWFCRICEMASRRRRRGTGGQQRRYKFPYGDFNNVHRCAVLAAEARAG